MEACEWCGAPFDDHGYEQQARYCYPAQLEVHRRRLCELIALMESDIAFGSITPGATRKLILTDARKLVPDMSPAKTLDEILLPTESNRPAEPTGAENGPGR
jgi:hypothetical protein